MTSAHWTTFADVRSKLRRRWDNGTYLTAWANDAEWEPIDISLRGPASRELADRFEDVRAWRSAWQAAHQRSSFRLVTHAVGGRTIGANDLPARLFVEGWDDLWRLLEVRSLVRRFDELRASTAEGQPRLTAWMNAHPMAVLAYEASWPQLVSTVGWLESERGRGRYLRQVPIPGVDTKFIENHRRILADLLDWLLPAGSVDQNVPRAQFARRYGFASQPLYVRFRLLGDTPGPIPCVREMSVRAGDFAAVAPKAATNVFIVENEITYLAFPDVHQAVVVFGSGYALSVIASLPWLSTRRVRYWGDLDTHGFAILSQLRARLPAVESFLMDRATLIGHQGQWVREAVPVRSPLSHLTSAEEQVYRDLVEDVLGRSVRLEQERIGFDWIERALVPRPDLVVTNVIHAPQDASLRPSRDPAGVSKLSEPQAVMPGVE